MKTPSALNRRQFLSGLFSAGAARFLSWESGTSATIQPTDHTPRVNALIRVLQEHHLRHDDVLHEEQKANLVYAFDKIDPSNHVEEAVAVALSMSYQPACHIVDEYVRRKKGEAPLLPEHPVMMLKNWGVPDTYRMLIFREQVNALLAELIGGTLEHGRRLCNKIMLREVKEQGFTSLLGDKYRGFRAKEIKVIYDAVCYYGPSARPYTWCSSMVSRADAVVAPFYTISSR
jgi:hypothetical protein